MLRGVLLDIDGVLHVSMQSVPGAAETLNWLEQQGYRTCFVTNTTTMGRGVLAQRLQKIGLPVQEERIMTAPVATADYIRQHLPGKRCWVLTKGDTEADFAGIEQVEGLTTAAEVVVIGGAEELLTMKQ
jgi:ribonucleotide monophosphatase NagD (HAD superfamily)